MVSEKELQEAKAKYIENETRKIRTEAEEKIKKITCENCKFAKIKKARWYRDEDLICLVTNKKYHDSGRGFYHGYNYLRAQDCPTYINKYFGTCNNTREHIENLRITERTVDIFNRNKKEK